MSRVRELVRRQDTGLIYYYQDDHANHIISLDTKIELFRSFTISTFFEFFYYSSIGLSNKFTFCDGTILHFLYVYDEKRSWEPLLRIIIYIKNIYMTTGKKVQKLNIVEKIIIIINY